MQVSFIRTKTVFDESVHRETGHYVVESVTHTKVLVGVEDELPDSEWAGEFVRYEWTPVTP